MVFKRPIKRRVGIISSNFKLMLNKYIIVFAITGCITVSCSIEKSIILEINRTQKNQHDNVDIVYNKQLKKMYYKYVNKFRNKIISDFIKDQYCLDTFYLLEIKKDVQFQIKGYLWNKEVYKSYTIDDIEKKEMLITQISRDFLIEQPYYDYVQRIESGNFLDQSNNTKVRIIGGPVIILIRVIKSEENLKVDIEQFWAY